MKRYCLYYLFFAFIVLFVCGCSSTKKAVNKPATRTTVNVKRNSSYLAYIQEYNPIAVEQMKRYKIPASITLAQGLLESGAGKSSLTRASNNHFGIKATSDWKGKTVSSPDNGRVCKFRAYKSARDSYNDHSRFLSMNVRYGSLFSLKTTDYKGWAHGLKKAGYAEDSKYPQKLINLIELYELYEYDEKGGKAKTDREDYTAAFSHDVLMGNGLYYIRARRGDTFKSLSKEMGINQSKLIKYNDLYDGYILQEGDIIYLQKKNKKASSKYKTYVIKAGESLYSVSQRYGIRLDRLYKMNGWDSEHRPECGDVVKLR